MHNERLLLRRISVLMSQWSSCVLYLALPVFVTFDNVIIYQKRVNKTNCPVQLLLGCHNSKPAKEALSAFKACLPVILAFHSVFIPLSSSGGRAQQALLSSDCRHFQRIPSPWFYPHCHGLVLAVVTKCCKACSFHVLTAGMHMAAAQCQHFMQHTLAWILMPFCYATWGTKTNGTTFTDSNCAWCIYCSLVMILRLLLFCGYVTFNDWITVV